MASKKCSIENKRSLKRNRDNADNEDSEEIDSFKKSCSETSLTHSQKLPVIQASQLLSPITSQETSFSSEILEQRVFNSCEAQDSRSNLENEAEKKEICYSSPPEEDTQAFSQIDSFSRFHTDSGGDGWGFLIPIDGVSSNTMILKKSAISQNPHDEPKNSSEELLEKNYTSTNGYLIGRHLECDFVIEDPLISNRHAIIFTELREGHVVAVIEDLSSNGTFVNEGIIGKNKRRELHDFDEIAILDKARFIFRYSKKRYSGCFRQDYDLLEKLGKGHYAEVFKCVKKLTGCEYAVKIFNVQHNESDINSLKQEIGILMGLSHPNILRLIGAFEEPNSIYLLLELACEGELFKWIVEKEKLTEKETRSIFIQLFQGVKYLHDRGIAHRDIKPENILLMNRTPTIKLGDFGLAKIVGEESFTTSLCGTPSYVAPEILEDSDNRRYNRAVDIWALGVVLYICLCGFPPFSDELTSNDYPYTLVQQIKIGQFDFPSPYWDNIGDSALDLIDKMLTVDVNKRINIDQCLEHPWLTQRESTTLPGDYSEVLDELAQLDFSKRRINRERTLLTKTYSTKITENSSLKVSKIPIQD
ncbi:putative serine/threonine-protein kinase fhkC [Erysiphe necator]|nr:putative serine/threonine-protein kinase fhkC [Erysiphe necator]